MDLKNKDGDYSPNISFDEDDYLNGYEQQLGIINDHKSEEVTSNCHFEIKSDKTIRYLNIFPPSRLTVYNTDDTLNQ